MTVLSRPIRLTILLTLAATTPASAGYSFSISASPKDPFVNVSPSTHTVRALYLWLICAEEGLSAFEGDVTGTMNVLGFTPLNDAMNVGGASNLLLAVGGCPKGPTLSHVLGYWIVLDRGGTLCLGPSSANHLIGAVDCSGDPVLIEDPEVLGFSSAGAETTSDGTALPPGEAPSDDATLRDAPPEGAAQAPGTPVAQEPCYAGRNGCEESAPHP
jgi:hypothetical protein